MERQFTVPIAVAAAVHVGLLFGFRGHRPPVELRHDAVRSVVATFFYSRDAEEPPPRSDEPSEPPPKGAPEALCPTNEELAPTDVTDRIKVDVPSRPAVRLPNITHISPNVIGDPNGDPDGRPKFDGIVRSGDLDHTPQTRYQAAPQYPFEAKREGRTGAVTVEFVVDESGRVLEPRVVSSSDRVFEEATLRAVAKWRFDPGKRNGRVVRFRMAVPVVFNLNDN
jgi:protein TonB